MYQKNAFECPCFYFTLQSRLDLDFDLLLAQSVQFSKIAKNSNIDFCQLFSHWKEALSLSKSWNMKWGHRARFCSRAAESAHQLYFLQFLREDWDEFQNGIYAEGGRKHWNICFLRIYIEISQLRYSVIEMVLKWNLKWFNTTLTSTTVRWGRWTLQHAYHLRYAHSQHIESHRGQKQPQLRSPITFLRLISLRRTSFHEWCFFRPFFHGGHIAMRSEGCAV